MVARFPFADICRMNVRAIAACLVLAACLGLTATAAEVTAQLDRESVPAGSVAIMTLRISGGRAGQPAIADVPNLIVEPRGQSRQTQWINGTTTSTVIHHYAVGSNTPGDYQIPAIDVMVDGKKFSTQPLKLKVLAAAAAQPPAGIPATPPGTPPDGDAETDTGPNRFGFLTVEPASTDREYVYVGEIAPVRIRAWLPADARAQLRSGIQPEGKAFTLHNVSDQAQQTQEIKDGKRYLVVTWFGGISATKAGKFPASLSLNATVAVRDSTAPKPRRRTGGPFDDPFFDSILDNMNVPMIQKDVTLKSDDRQIEVRPLPAAGRPNGFSGAVGDFKFDDWDLPAAWRSGEPQQITARLSGSGNFTLMNAPEFSPSDAWKTYPGKSEFTPGDVASFSGSKSFQFSAVPRKGGAQKAGLTFSFFDPNAGFYKTLTSPLKPIQVAGEDLADDPPAAVAPPPAKESGPKDRGGLVAQHLLLSPRASLVPLVSRPEFALWLEIAGALCLLGPILAWLRRRRSDPRRYARARLERATREALQAAARCAADRDVSGYFVAARLAIQEQLGAQWNQLPHAITLAEIQTRIGDDSPVTAFFREADRQAYSCQGTGEILPEWKTQLDDALAFLNATTPPHAL
jgi:hypothetical protein